MIVRRNSITRIPSWLKPDVRNFTIPMLGREPDALVSRTSLRAYRVSPSNTGAGSRTSSQPRLIAFNETSETDSPVTVSYTHLRAHETGRNLVCRLLLE